MLREHSGEEDTIGIRIRGIKLITPSET